MIQDTIQEFGQQLGIADLRLSANDDVVLEIDGIGASSIRVLGDTLFLSLARESPIANEPSAARLLACAHYRNCPRFPLEFRRTGFGHTTVVATRLATETTRGTDVLEALDFLTNTMDRVSRPA